MDLSKRLAPAGLIFLGLLGSEIPFIPPTLAMFSPGYPPDPNKLSRSIVGIDTPDFIVKANKDWFDISLEGGLFASEREFLVAVKVDEETNDWWWARVRLAQSWDIMGSGAGAALGLGYGAPEFSMLSSTGDVIVCGMSDDSTIGTVLVKGFQNFEGLHRIAAWKASWPLTPELEKATCGRWIKSIFK